MDHPPWTTSRLVLTNISRIGTYTMKRPPGNFKGIQYPEYNISHHTCHPPQELVPLFLTVYLGGGKEIISNRGIGFTYNPELTFPSCSFLCSSFLAFDTLLECLVFLPLQLIFLENLETDYLSNRYQENGCF